MSKTSQRHVLAVLRNLIGLKQSAMAHVLGCSLQTVQSIELMNGRLKLSERLAGVVSLKTGVNVGWLLDNDPSKPPIDVDGEPYTMEKFEEFQAADAVKKIPLHALMAADHARSVNICRLQALLLRAFKDDRLTLCAYKLARAFDELEKHFGVTDADRTAVEPPEIDDPSALNRPSRESARFVAAMSAELQSKDEVFLRKIRDGGSVIVGVNLDEVGGFGLGSDGQIRLSVSPKNLTKVGPNPKGQSVKPPDAPAV